MTRKLENGTAAATEIPPKKRKMIHPPKPLLRVSEAQLNYASRHKCEIIPF